jgi:lipopolysaccharide biosynthesis regulator YciM
MSDNLLLIGTVAVAALVIGILAGHFGWGRRWPSLSKLHPDYLAGLDYLVTEQPDRALDMFLKLMDASADTIETHFSLGSLYRRRGEVERAIRIHQNLLAREALAPEHREQALMALAQDYLRAGLLDRAEGLLLQVSAVPRLRATALDALRGVYEGQREWRQALEVHRTLSRMRAAPPGFVSAHYLCEIASLAIERGDLGEARRLLREALTEASPSPRAGILNAQIAEREGDAELAVRLLRGALLEAPNLILEELTHLLRLASAERRDALLEELVVQMTPDPDQLKRLVFAAIAADLTDAPPLRAALERVFTGDATLRLVWQGGSRARPPGGGAGSAVASTGAAAVPDTVLGSVPGTDLGRVAHEIGALLANAEKYRCNECGFGGGVIFTGIAPRVIPGIVLNPTPSLNWAEIRYSQARSKTK